MSGTKPTAGELDDTYFLRRALWDWHDGATIDLVDDAGRAVTTLDTWQTLVFHHADGDRRVGELIAWLATQYRNPDERPADLAEQVRAALGALLEANAVELAERSRDLPYHVALPRKEHDAESARASMAEAHQADGR